MSECGGTLSFKLALGIVQLGVSVSSIYHRFSHLAQMDTFKDMFALGGGAPAAGLEVSSADPPS
jgi:hypothetical protein